jgi:DNA repair exonuclease SbcCD ATPase subunit
MTSYFIELQKKLRSVVEYEKRRDGLRKLFISTTILCILFLVLILLEAVGNLSSDNRTILFYSFLIVTVLTIGLYVAFPFIKDFIYYVNPDYVETASKVGAHYQEIKDELANAVQLINENNINYSNQLVDAAFKNVYSKTEKLNFNTVVDFTSTKKLWKLYITTFIATIILVFFVPSLHSAAIRFLNYNKNYTPPPKFVFEIDPGNKELTKGDNITITIKAVGEQPKEIYLLEKSEEQTDFSEKILSPDSLGIFTLYINNVKNSLEYFATAENITSEKYKISVINRPIISSIELTITPPAYARLPEQTQKDNGNITALIGSKIKLTMSSSRNLSSAIVMFSDSTSKMMNIASAKASADFNVAKKTGYYILIADAQGYSNINPITYSIKTFVDENPSIEMISPNENIKLGNQSKISLISKISDDYGFSKMNLSFRLSASKYRPTNEEFTQVPITISNQQKEEEVYFVWDLAPLVLAEGEVLSYYFEVFDNDNISGPKSTKTKQFTITVPSLNELFAGAEDKQKESEKDLSQTLKDAEQLKQEMQKLSDDMKQNSKEISWQEKERVEKAVDKFKEITKKIGDISQKLSEMKNDLAKNNLLSEETLQKYNELQELLEKMSTEEMKEAFKRLQESLNSMNRDNMQMSMEEMKANEEYIKKSIERTLNLLKRIQIEQKVDELVKRTEELNRKLDELKSKTDQSNLSDKTKRDELTNRQRNITSDLKKLNDEVNKLGEKMNELSDMPKDQMEKLKDDLEKQNNEQLSDEAVKNLQQMQKMQSMQNQQKLSQNMGGIQKQLQNLQNAMQQMNQMKVFYDMMKILDDLLTLSKDQESLKNNTEQLSPYSNEFPKNSRDQNDIQNNLGKVLQKMSDLSQKTFAITPEMGKALGKALTNMQQSINAMQNQQGPPAAQMQKNAMASLNEAASLMKGAMDQMMSGGGKGGGMMSLMQQLQMMAQQQMDLNKLTQMLNQGQLSQEMAAQMQRLAQQQEAIRKSLEQLNQEAKEAGQSKRLASNLEKILSEMKEVVTNLQSEKMNDDLVKQQEKILSKLLDAQTSMNERDYEKDRKSSSGKEFSRNSPPDLILNTDEGKNKLKDELLKAIREGYKKDYEDLIRKYFEALEKVRGEK